MQSFLKVISEAMKKHGVNKPVTLIQLHNLVQAAMKQELTEPADVVLYKDPPGIVEDIPTTKISTDLKLSELEGLEDNKWGPPMNKDENA